MTPPSIHHELSADKFWQQFFIQGRPLVFRNVYSLPGWQTDSFIKRIKHLLSQKIAKPIGFAIWLNAHEIESIIPQPPWVSHCFNHKNTRFRHSNCRVFSCPEGHYTTWHYDPHLVFNFNLQLQGQKKWTLISPNSSFHHYGFSFFGPAHEKPGSFNQKDCITITLNPGDMLYVPPLWAHEVEAIGKDCLSVSWIGINDHAIVTSERFKREKELLRLAYLLKKAHLDRYLAKLSGGGTHYYSQYAGLGWNYIRSLTVNVTNWQVLTRILKELRYTPHYFLDRKAIKKAKIKPKMIW